MENETPEHLTNCPVCWYPYSKQKRIPLVGTCGHTICRFCVRSIRTSSCPICQKLGSFLEETKNFLAYDLLDHYTLLQEEQEPKELLQIQVLKPLHQIVEGIRTAIRDTEISFYRLGRMDWTGLILAALCIYAVLFCFGKHSHLGVKITNPNIHIF